MRPEEIAMIRRILPEEMVFDYYADRESPWLLSQLMPERAPVGRLKGENYARLLSRPLVRPIVAACGGMLSQRDVLAAAHADRALRMPKIGRPGRIALDQAFQAPWQDFVLSFDTWTGQQMSRAGGNLVIQLGFPSDHAELMGRHFDGDVRHKFEESLHPVRATGRPTLAWARVDVDLDCGEALIEEVQSDWLRFVRDEREWLEIESPQSRDLRQTQAYERAVIDRYDKTWPQVMMLAVLVILRQEFAVRDVWMHQPVPGAVLKGVWGGAPPRSLYTNLPRAFCFRPSWEVPRMLARPLSGKGTPDRRRHVKLLDRLRSAHRGPLFWRLRF